MSKFLIFIKEYGVVIAAAIGALASLYIYRTQYKKATYFEMYKRCYTPIYYLIIQEIDTVSNSTTPLNAFLGKYADITISKSKTLKYKQSILQVLNENLEYCPKALLIATDNLAPDNFAEYCLSINDNYLACQSKLGITALKPNQTIKARRIKTVISIIIAALLVIAAFISFILYLKGEWFKALAIISIAVYIALMWTLLFDR